MNESTAGNSRSTPPILDAMGAADYLGCTPATIRRMTRDGKLAAARVGDRLRYRLADLDALFTTAEGGPRRD